MRTTAAIIVCITASLIAAVTAAPPATGPGSAADLVGSIKELSSTDGQARVVATKAIFDSGKDALEVLSPSEAGPAWETEPDPAPRSREEMVYSLLKGLKLERRPGRIDPNSFVLFVEETCSPKEIRAMGERRGFAVLPGSERGVRAVLLRGDLAGTLREILTTEPQVITVELAWMRPTLLDVALLVLLFGAIAVGGALVGTRRHWRIWVPAVVLGIPLGIVLEPIFFPGQDRMCFMLDWPFWFILAAYLGVGLHVFLDMLRALWRADEPVQD